MESKTLRDVIRRMISSPDNSWLDPRFVTAVTDVNSTDITVPPNIATQIAPANASRIAIGIFNDNAIGIVDHIGPWPDVQFFPFAIVGSVDLKWYTVFDFPGIIGNRWFAFSDSGITYRVIDVRRIAGV